MGIVENRKIFYAISGILFIASLGALFTFGLKFGIDFTGGSLLEVEYASARPSVDEVRNTLGSTFGNAVIQPIGEKGLIIRSRDLSEEEHQNMLGALKGFSAQTGQDNAVEPGLVIEKQFTSIGPTIGRELRQKSLWAIAIVILLIMVYIAWAFRGVSKPIASWKYGVTTVIALFHDVVIPAGFFAIAGHFLAYEVDTLIVTAILTILGFSVHDTIVVFDRVRENLKKLGEMHDFETLVGISVRQTLVRSINTSLTVVLALAAVYFFGGETTRVFSLTLIIGIVIGTYSSICIASPLLVTWYQRKQK